MKELISTFFTLILFSITVNAQCSTTVSFDEWLYSGQSVDQNQELSGSVTSITFNLDFTMGTGIEWNPWPADLILLIYSPNGNCIGGEGYDINPPETCTEYEINFPDEWVNEVNGFYTFTMYPPANYLSGDGTWYFTLQNGCNYCNSANYDLNVIINGICDQGGCYNPWACNYDPDAPYEDNSICIYPEFGYDCDGNCIADSDGDGICDMFEVPGCSDFSACNYSSSATDDDGTCWYANIDEDCSGNSLLPTFNNAPIDITVSCSNLVIPTTVYASISPFASEFEQNYNPDGNCYDDNWLVDVIMTEQTIPGSCPGNYTIVREYTGTDCMGRQCFHSQTVSIVDNTPPEFTTGLETQNSTCPIQVSFPNAEAIDACSEPLDLIIGMEESIPGVCDGEYTLYRTITAVDACGNSSTAEQSIVVIDEAAPVWTELLPSPVISDEIETEDFGTPQAEDLCSNTAISVTSEIGPGACPLAVELTKTFIATDDCGNESEPFIQIINETTDLVSYVTATVDATCSYSSDGSVDIETLGGIGPYVTDFGNLDPEALSAGDYSITVSDDNLCSTVLAFTIGAPPALQLELDASLPECIVPNSGVISANIAGGTGDLSIDWGGINPNSVNAGNYSVTVYDENGCSISDDVTVEPAIIPIDGELEGDTEVMLGDSSLYEYDFTAGSTYEWTFYGADSLVVSNIFAISLLWTTEGEGMVCVQETNSSGCVGEEVCLNINVSMELEELVGNNEIIVFPNPNRGEFSCTLNALEGLQDWVLMDLNGSELSRGKVHSSTNTFKFNFTKLSVGQYVLVIDNKAIPILIEH